jgi:hypothetical protein
MTIRIASLLWIAALGGLLAVGIMPRTALAADAADTADASPPPAVAAPAPASAPVPASASIPMPMQMPESPTPALDYYPVLPYGADADTVPALLPLASNRPLNGNYAGITRAVVAIHDFSRDANGMVAMLAALAGNGNANLIIVAPQFPLESDISRYAEHLSDGGRGLLRWSLASPVGGWESGGESVAVPPQRSVSSFTALDELLLFLGEKKIFPDLKDIVIAGHGMGADFVLRYAALGKAPDLLDENGISVRFVAADAASYLYFTPLRPAMGEKLSFITPDTAKCPDYDAYKYGLSNLNDYGRRTGTDAIRLRYVTRRVIYLAGEKVAGDERFPDMNCAALLEGPDRLARAMNYDVYLSMIFGDAVRLHEFATVPAAGYDAAAIFGSACGMEALFGAGECKSALRGEETPQ